MNVIAFARPRDGVGARTGEKPSVNSRAPELDYRQAIGVSMVLRYLARVEERCVAQRPANQPGDKRSR